MVYRTMLVAVAFVALVLAAPQAAPLAAAQAANAEKLSRDWKRVRTASFEAVTNGPIDEVRRVLDELEVFRTNLVTRFLRLRTSAALPTLVVVFKSEGAFEKFTPRDEKGRREFVGAYFMKGPDMNHIVLPNARGEDLKPTEAAALLAEVRPDLVPGSWTMKVMDFMEGRLAADRFLAAAKDIEERTEANAYVGFKALCSGRREEAITRLKWVRERGTSAYVEYRMAVAELKRLEKPAVGAR